MSNIKCYLCGAQGKNDFNFLTNRFRYHVQKTAYQCRKCSLVFILPKMSMKEERAFYNKEYGVIFSREKGTTPAQLFKKRLPETKRYKDLLKGQLSKSHDCLEIGCASGYFLHSIKDSVRSVMGIESHMQLKKYCKKVAIPTVDDTRTLSDNKFDRIFLFFVLEHLGEPLSFLKEIKRLLKKKGKVFIEVPNIDDALFSLYKIQAFKDFYFTPAHQFYYVKKTLNRLLKKAGFGKIHVRLDQRYDLSNHIHWMLEGKPGGQAKYNGVFSKDLLENYKKSLLKHERADTLFAMAQKK